MIYTNYFVFFHQVSGSDFVMRSPQHARVILYSISDARHSSSARAKFALTDVFNGVLPPSHLLQSLAPLSQSNTMVYPPIRLYEKIVSLRYDHLAQDALERIGELNKYDVAGRLAVQVTGHPVDYPGGTTGMFRDIIEHVFQTETGLFEPVMGEKRQLVAAIPSS